ncbi:sugar transferase [Moritella sp. 24]|uniref:sugar transferase n=1 Tax=Moritella sp. 24 TaxID=2746230 RepID=UPI001BA79C18|nr:sugar transferase [Moritella sp. 24]QUM75958.1 sugar transferase [Moritella sp. 24]
MQRFFDILFSGLALLFFSPLLVSIAILLRFTGEGEVFFIQPRVGKNGKMIGLIKFVTMVKDSPNMAMGTVTVKDDPRVLPIGKFLRKSKINELPQLWNVFRGNMSVIGPRPQAERCFNAFSEAAQIAIKQVKPGLSGIGSIVFRDEESILDNPDIDRLQYYDDVIAPYKGELEQWFIHNQDLYTYFMLIGLTVWMLLFPKSERYKEMIVGLPQVPEDLKCYI